MYNIKWVRMIKQYLIKMSLNCTTLSTTCGKHVNGPSPGPPTTVPEDSHHGRISGHAGCRDDTRLLSLQVQNRGRHRG